MSVNPDTSSLDEVTEHVSEDAGRYKGMTPRDIHNELTKGKDPDSAINKSWNVWLVDSLVEALSAGVPVVFETSSGDYVANDELVALTPDWAIFNVEVADKVDEDGEPTADAVVTPVRRLVARTEVLQVSMLVTQTA